MKTATPIQESVNPGYREGQICNIYKLSENINDYNYVFVSTLENDEFNFATAVFPFETMTEEVQWEVVLLETNSNSHKEALKKLGYETLEYDEIVAENIIEKEKQLVESYYNNKYSKFEM